MDEFFLIDLQMMSGKNYIKLSELNRVIADSIEASFDQSYFWVVCEVADVKNYPDRFYCFMSLVEKENQKLIAKSEAVIWRNTYHIIQKFERETNTKFASGLQLLLQLSVTYHVQFGLKLVVHEIDSSFTLGNIELEKTKILNKLVSQHASLVQFDGENYMTLNKRYGIPTIIKSIALITAPDSDGQRDFKHELEHNVDGIVYQVHEFLTQIQGNDAHVSIIAQLEKIKLSKTSFDVVVIARGGGSTTDLSSFDTLELALAAAAFPIPILSGIGHERNISILDLLVNRSLKTPTKVASFINDHNAIFKSEITDLRNELRYYAQQLLISKTDDVIRAKDKLKQHATRLIEKQQQKLEKAKLIIDLVSPAKILARGFAIIKHQGKIVRNADSINTNDLLEIEFLKETVQTEVKTKIKK
jgi:exodeoxyribonuclease VII large subunit